MPTLLAPPGPPPISGPFPATQPGQKIWTVQQFHYLGDLGIFEGRHAMLIDGVIIEDGPMNPPHRIALELATETIRIAFGAGGRICVQMPLILGQTTDPEPDIVVVRGSPRGTQDHPTSAELIIEVSDRSLKYDTTEKMSLYAASGIADYWVVDVTGRQLLVYRDPVPDAKAAFGSTYRSVQTLNETDSIAPLANPSVTISVGEFLP
jgi:Uma2 family endonuclease